MHHHRTPGRGLATVLSVTALLAVTVACGGADDTSDEDEDAVPSEATAPAGSPSPETEPEDEASSSPDAGAGPSDDAPDPGDALPEIRLPDEVDVVLDWEPFDDPEEAGAVESGTNFLMAVTEAAAEGDPDHPHYQAYSDMSAQDEARDEITAWTDAGLTPSGTDRYFAPELKIGGGGEVIYGLELCRDLADLTGKDTDTGELVPQVASGEHGEYVLYGFGLSESRGAEDSWTVMTVMVTENSAECAERDG